MILQLGNYIKAEVYVTLHISVECGQLSGQYGRIQMKTGKWFIKPVLPVTIFFRFGRILTALQPV